MLRFLAVGVVSLMFLSPGVGIAEVELPSKSLKKVLDEIYQTVNGKVETTSDKELDRKLKDIIFPIFDFREMARRSLGANWRKASVDQQLEFVDLFSDLLARSYLTKIKSGVADSKIDILDEATKGKRAVVKTVVITNDEKAAVVYRWRLKKDKWKIYDVIVENVGIVTNYRSEFADIVRKEKVEGLLVRLREKLAA